MYVVILLFTLQGQLGVESTNAQLTPKQVQFLLPNYRVLKTAVGMEHSIFLVESNGTPKIVVTGNNGTNMHFYSLCLLENLLLSSQISQDLVTTPYELTFALKESETIVNICAGSSTSAIHTSLGRLFVWGDGITDATLVALTNVSHVACASSFWFIVTEQKSLFIAVFASSSLFKIAPSKNMQLIPLNFPSTDITEIKAGFFHALISTAKEELFAAGFNFAFSKCM